jgi:hypothetical protein
MKKPTRPPKPFRVELWPEGAALLGRLEKHHHYTAEAIIYYALALFAAATMPPTRPSPIPAVREKQKTVQPIASTLKRIMTKYKKGAAL